MFISKSVPSNVYKTQMSTKEGNELSAHWRQGREDTKIHSSRQIKVDLSIFLKFIKKENSVLFFLIPLISLMNI